MIESFISVLGDLASIYSGLSSVGSGKFQKRLIAVLEQTKTEIVRLNERMLYVPHACPITAQSAPISKPLTLREIREILEPVQHAVGEDIISSGLFPTPEKLQQLFRLNPWDCLHEVRPLAYARSDLGADWAPLLFTYNNVPMVGWQKRGMLQAVLGIEFRDTIDAWLQQSWETSKQPLNDREAEDFQGDAAPVGAGLRQQSLAVEQGGPSLDVQDTIPVRQVSQHYLHDPTTEKDIPIDRAPTPRSAIRVQENIQTWRATGKQDEKDFQATLARANAGDDDAKCKVAAMYVKGIGTQKNIAEAVRWYEAAAQCGNGEAAFQIAELIVAGQIALEPDTVVLRLGERDIPIQPTSSGMDKIRQVTQQAAAQKWYAKAAQCGHATARDRLKRYRAN